MYVCSYVVYIVYPSHFITVMGNVRIHTRNPCGPEYCSCLQIIVQQHKSIERTSATEQAF